MKSTMLVLVICLILIPSGFFFMGDADEGLHTDYQRTKESYENISVHMNDIIERYNDEETISTDRLALVEDYLYYYDKIAAIDFYGYVDSNEEQLQSEGYEVEKIKESLSSSGQIMQNNIDGFKKDIGLLEGNILIRSFPETIELRENISRRLESY